MTSLHAPTTVAEPISSPQPSPRVMIACSGLGRIRRGNETWAQNVAEGLARAGTQVTLAGGGPVPSVQCRYRQFANVPRESVITRRWLPWHRRYLFEQLGLTASLLMHRVWREIDILHVADPDMALQLHRRAKGKGLRVVYKDGLSLGPTFCSRFDYVQVLAPYYLEVGQARGVDTKGWAVIPHLVNTERFAPASDQAKVRMSLQVPGVTPDSCVVLAVGDFSPSSNKRLDWIVREFSMLPVPHRFHLFLAGHASGPESLQFEREARALVRDRLHLFRNLGPDQMVSLYQAADLFAHAALKEPFGIVFLEAMASGLPLVGHNFPATEWIIGEGGGTIDMAKPGGLAATLELWGREERLRRALGEAARNRATKIFAEERIIPLYQRMYGQIMLERHSS